MNWKQFLKPDWRKIVLTIVLFIVGIFVSLFINSCFGCYEVSIGFPLGFALLSDFTPIPINFPFLLIDLIFWYLLSCLIIWIYDRRKKK